MSTPDPVVQSGIETFRAAWLAADERGETGYRVEAGIRALLDDGWAPPPPSDPPDPLQDSVVQRITDLLTLVEEEYPGAPVTCDEVVAWTPEDQSAVMVWAGSVHYYASDQDDIEIPDLPAVLADRGGA